MNYLLSIFLTVTLAACGTLNTAQPLKPGEKSVGATLGGPLFKLGSATLPMPNMLMEYRQGIQPITGRATEWNVGLQGTPLAFGIVGIHAGAAHQLYANNKNLVSVAMKVFFLSNHLDSRKDDPGAMAVIQNEFTYARQWKSHLLYTGLSQYTDVAQASLILAPFIGASWRISNCWAIQSEVRWLGFNRPYTSEVIKWKGIDERGSISPTLSFEYSFSNGGSK